MDDAATTASAAAAATSLTIMTSTNVTKQWAMGMMMNGTYITQTQAQFNHTVMLINSLLLSKVQSLRSMHVALGAFSLVLGLMMIIRIVNDARKSAALQVTLRPRRFDLLMNVHPAETFPLALGGAIVIQQLAFVAVQSTALNSVLVSGCGGVAQILFPTIFIIGYTTLTFSIEMMVRSLRSRRFRPRGKWSTPICIIATAAGMLFTWIPTAVWRAPNRCFGSLIWFTVNFHLVAIGIISFLLFMFIIVGLVIALRLKKTRKLDLDERVSASRICYYLGVSTILYSFVLPFYIQSYLRNFDSRLTTSRLAEVSLFSSGIFVAFLHLFLRVNASRMVIQPWGKSGQLRPRIRFFGPSDLSLTISGPIIPQDSGRDDIPLYPEKQAFPDSETYYFRPEKTPTDLKHQSVDPTRWPLPPNSPAATEAPPAAQPVENTGLHKRNKSNYSLFPTRAEDVPRLPATVYSPPGNSKKLSFLNKRATTASVAQSVTDVSEAYLLPPNAPFASKRHKRDSSSGSSATVQIGLRFSVAPAAIAAGDCTAVNRIVGQRQPLPPSELRRDPSDSSGESIGLPIQQFSSNSSSETASLEKPVEMPKPLDIHKAVEMAKPAPVASPRSPQRIGLPSGPKITPANDPGQYLQDARNKVLPPTPRVIAQKAPAVVPPPPVPHPPHFSGLRINPVSPPKNSASSGLGANTISRSPPPNGGPTPGWI